MHATDAETQLVIAGYLLGYAVFLITGGRVGDLFVWSFHHSDDALCGAFVRSATAGQLFVFMGTGFMICSLLAVRLVTRYCMAAGRGL
jgi:MFS family permease